MKHYDYGGVLIMCLDMVCYASERQKDYEFTTLEYFASKETTYSRFPFTSRTLPRSVGISFENAYSSSETKGMCLQLFALFSFFSHLSDILPALEHLPGMLPQVNWTMAVLGQPKPVPSIST